MSFVTPNSRRVSVTLAEPEWRLISRRLVDTGYPELAQKIDDVLTPPVTLEPTDPRTKVRDNAGDIWIRVPALSDGWHCMTADGGVTSRGAPWSTVLEAFGPLRIVS